jgi:copper chaperone NosL
MKLEKPVAKFYAFLDQPLIFTQRVIIAASVAFLVLAFFSPLWRISMEAPQYPEGLWMDVWVYDLVGGNDGQHLDEINTLNHYIGMHRIERTDFADLDWMPFAFGFLALIALRVAAVGNVRSLVDLSVLTVYVLGFAGARFVYKLYVFGHDLDPHAPFDVEPFMPVVIGTKQIANFTTHSMPQLGTLWVTLFALTISACAVWHLIAGRRAAVRRAREAAAAVTAPATVQPEPAGA